MQAASGHPFIRSELRVRSHLSNKVQLLRICQKLVYGNHH